MFHRKESQKLEVSPKAQRKKFPNLASWRPGEKNIREFLAVQNCVGSDHTFVQSFFVFYVFFAVALCLLFRLTQELQVVFDFLRNR